MLSKLLLTLSAIFILSCSGIPTTRPDHIIIVCKKEQIYTDTLYLTDRGKEGPRVYETDPVIFDFRTPLFENIEPIRDVSSDTLTIPVLSDYAIVEYRYNPIETIEFIARKGDTVIINNCGAHPDVTTSNSPRNVDYDNVRDGRLGFINGYSIKLILGLPQLLLYHPIDGKTYVEAQDSIKQRYREFLKDESCLLDSLHYSRILDSVQYRYYKTRNHYQQLNLELESLSKDELIDILASYSEKEYKGDFYRFYNTYFFRVATEYYYDKTISLSNGADYDYQYVFDHINQDTLLHGRLRDAHLYQCFRKIDELCPIVDARKYYEAAVANIRDTAILRNLHHNYDKIYANEIVYTDDLLLQDPIGETGSLREILAANVGKVVYVDFWASWCAPCMSEMPASKKLRDEYRGEKVVFIYLAFNDKEENWKNALDRAELNDLQHVYLVTNPRTSSFVEELKLKTIPRYLIYDKDGRLVNADAPRPGSKEIRSELNKYLY